MQSNHQVRDFNPLFVYLTNKDWKNAMNVLEENENCAFGCIKIKGFYDAPNPAQQHTASTNCLLKMFAPARTAASRAVIAGRRSMSTTPKLHKAKDEWQNLVKTRPPLDVSSS